MLLAAEAEKPQTDDLANGAVEIRDAAGASATFQPKFLVFYSQKSPSPALRYAEIPDVPNYNVLTWGRDANIKIDPTLHIQDGFDPEVDRRFGEGRTANVFSAAPFIELTANSSRRTNEGIEWSFDEHAWGRLAASVKWNGSQSGVADLHWTFTPKLKGYYSVAYLGAPTVDVAQAKEIWQPMIWNDRRFPHDSFLTPAFLCPLPGVMVHDGDKVLSVMAASEELPFQPMPTQSTNNPFGIALRNRDGQAQPMIFAPILGGEHSERKPGETLAFHCTLHVAAKNITELYEQIAREQFGFRDIRENKLCSLNRTLDNMIDYGMSEWSAFNADLRGSEYSTDAPGTVKNVSPLAPLGAALVTDDERIFHERALPITEYVCSREKLLFAVDPEIKIQSPSSNLKGPAVPLPDLAGTYAMSQGRSEVLRKLAYEDYGKDKIYNLDTPTPGRRWQNSLALYRISGDRSLLETAVKQAKEQIAERAKELPDHHRRGSFFWPSFTTPWIDYLELYEETGDQELLRAAQDGARHYVMFCWMCPSVPQGTVLVDESGQAPRYRKGTRYEDISVGPSEVEAWQVSEIGLTPESAGTCKGHRGILNAHFAPFMARIGHLTNDDFLCEVARWATIGRYRNFPGYHMNTARTTVFMEENFPLRPQAQLNATTSIHYNHIWSHIGLVIDSLVTEAWARTDGAVDFPSRFTEGYAYLQSKVYGDRPGRFYGNDGVWLWMPSKLLTFASPEINYVTARKGDSLYLLLMNESAKAIQDVVRVDEQRVHWPANGHAPQLTVLSPGMGTAELKQQAIHVELPPRGLVAVRLDGVKPKVFLQERTQQANDSYWPGPVRLKFAGATTGMVFSFGQGLTSAYLYLEANNQDVASATLHYTIDGVSGSSVDSRFPFEFTIPLPDEAEEFRFAVETTGQDGTSQKSEEGRLTRQRGTAPTP